jgi:hypothetical protein
MKYHVLYNGKPAHATPYVAVYHKVEKHAANWQNAFQDEFRQVLLIEQFGFNVYLDNHSGYAWHVCTKLNGIPTNKLRVVTRLALFGEVADKDLNREWNKERQAIDDDQLIDFVHDNYPHSAKHILKTLGLYRS